jgi:serine/threonine protein phosphatase 1
MPWTAAGPIWAVGDVHGCLGLYRVLERRILAEAGGPVAIVMLGDMIDRGPDSRGVIDHLLSPGADGLTRHAILGNHEDMLLRFLARPLLSGAWLGSGGVATLASYGIAAAGDGSDDLADLAHRLAEAMPAEHLDYLAHLPVGIDAGRYLLTHAGAGPEVPIARQGKADLTWARHGEIADLLPPADLGGRTVVHGHVPVDDPVMEGWRINVDTGAVTTGRLTAVKLADPFRPVFLTASARRN